MNITYSSGKTRAGETKRSGVVTQKCDGDRVYLLPRKKNGGRWPPLVVCQMRDRLTIFLVIRVARGHKLFCRRLGFLHFAFVSQLQRAVDLADQHVKAVAIVFHLCAV